MTECNCNAVTFQDTVFKYSLFSHFLTDQLSTVREIAKGQYLLLIFLVINVMFTQCFYPFYLFRIISFYFLYFISFY